MEDILKKLSEYAKYRVSEAKKLIPLNEIRRAAESCPKGDYPFTEALKSEGMSFICEVKKASPSKGIIAEEFPYLEIAREYEMAGAEAISVLTEPKWFLGSEKYLKEIADIVKTPILRKDFTVDPYMIYEAKVLGASAILLICSILEKGMMREYLAIAGDLGLSVLTEAHDEHEIQMALDLDAEIIGVNNRNLKDFSVDTGNAGKLKKLVPEDRIFVSESGITGPLDVTIARESGADAVLIGEAFMKSSDKAGFLKSLREA